MIDQPRVHDVTLEQDTWDHLEEHELGALVLKDTIEHIQQGDVLILRRLIRDDMDQPSCLLASVQAVLFHQGLLSGYILGAVRVLAEGDREEGWNPVG